MKTTTQSANGTSFYDHTIRATVNDLIQVCGKPYEHGDPNDKVQYEWLMETENGTVFTIYDWKEYRTFSENDVIAWHIGGNSGYEASKGLSELSQALDNESAKS